MKKFLLVFLWMLFLGAPAFAKTNPSITDGIAAVVNNGIVTKRDVVDRIALIQSSSGMPRSPDMAAKLAPQVLETLITEELQIQAGVDAGIVIPSSALDESVARVAADNKMTADQFTAVLKKQGVNVGSLKRQIQAQQTWAALVAQKLRPQIVVADSDIQAEKDRIAQFAGQNEYLLAEIYLGDAPNKPVSETTEFATKLQAELRKGVRFSELARQFSQSATAASGGIMGWLRDDQLDPAQKLAIQNLSPENPLSNPVRSENGVYLYLLRDKRLIAVPSATDTAQDTEIALRILRVPVQNNDVSSALLRAEDIRIKNPTCDALTARAASESDLKIDSMTMRLSTLADTEKSQLTGDALGAMGTAKADGAKTVSVRYVCARTAVTGSTFDDEIANRLGQARLEILARRYLRDLNAQAFIERRP